MLRVFYDEVIIDVMKLDVEGAEWPFLRDVVHTHHGKPLSLVRQLLVELHTPRFAVESPLSAAHLAEMISYVRTLRDLGFVLFRSIRNNNCCGRFAAMMPQGVKERCCVEAFFLNTRFSAYAALQPEPSNNRVA